MTNRCLFTLIAAIRCELESLHKDKILLLSVNVNLNIPSQTSEKYEFLRKASISSLYSFYK